MPNVIEGIQRECKRLREEVIPVYSSLEGGVGTPAILMMQTVMAEAESAIAMGDLVRMVTALAALKEFSL